MTLRAFDFTGLTWKKAQCEIKGSVNIMPDAAEIDESEEAKLKEALESDFSAMKTRASTTASLSV